MLRQTRAFGVRPSLCAYCARADRDCPIYPQATLSCVAFRPAHGRRRAALLLLAGAARGGDAAARRAFECLCALL